MRFMQRYRLLMALALVFATAGFQGVASARSMLDGDVRPVEAGSVELVVGSSGDVVQVRVEECEECERSSYLPARDLTVEYADKTVEPNQLGRINGGSATVVLDTNTDMVRKIDFWTQRGEGVAQ
ncbi:MAG: hypothetical protein H5U30_11255 [Marinobacter sp.]|nr:hypothetical protein [Marinobacter sp.]